MRRRNIWRDRAGFSDKYLPSCNLPPLKDVHAVYVYSSAHKHIYLS